MRRASPFGQLLDEKLQEYASTDARHASTAAHAACTTAPHPLLFASPYRSFTTSRIYVQATPVSTQRRSLSAAEQQALTVLNGLGASLSSDFTAADLRSAYRALALDYHPDRHASSDPAEKERLSRLFAEIVEHHRRLTPRVSTES